jgi:predicted DCC family thiol-disulfide oxidoreductase YuxK
VEIYDKQKPTIMNTLQNHVLLYDEDCPLCHWYSNLFIKNKLLDSHGRESYIDAVNQKKYPIDAVTAQNKIALVNILTNEVYYGADSMVKILSNSFPIIGKLYNIKPINWFIKGLYSFVSFNRKIVIPTDCNKLSTCSPTRNLFWRAYFIVFFTLLNSFIFNAFISACLPFHASYFKYFVILFCLQLLLTWIACKLLKEPNVYDYLGQIVFIIFLCSLLLIIPILIAKIFLIYNINADLLLYGVGIGIGIFALLQHNKRVKLAGFNKNLAIAWPIIIGVTYLLFTVYILCLYFYIY